MINRNLIRIRIVQIVYSWYQNPNRGLASAEKELLYGLQRSYDLYHYLLELMIRITDEHAARLETKKSKLLPTEEDLHPNTNLVNNAFIAQLRANKQLSSYLEERPMDWEQYDHFIKRLLDQILKSDYYADYVELSHPTYAEDREFWRKIFKKMIYNNSLLDELLEDESIFWNDDVEIVQSFVFKTIKFFEQEKGEDQELLPMFRSQDDKKFALDLLDNAIKDEAKYRELIKTHTDKWDYDRIAFMDLIIMQIAIAEICNFPSIPTSVTLNEYIDMAKVYSTPKSGLFVNGILDAVINHLKTERLIIKD